MIEAFDVRPWEVLSFLMCFLLSGFFSGSEAALMSLGMDRAKQLLKEGGEKMKAMAFMVEKPNELLATILVGNNIVNIFAATLATTMATRLFESQALAIATGVTTLLILIFGEVIPKTFASINAEKFSVFILRILRINYYLLYPVIQLMVLLVKATLGKNAEFKSGLVTKNDIEYMINKAEQDQTMDSKQLDLLNSILEFPTIKVKDIMIPRLEVKYIQRNWNFKKIIDFVEPDNYSRYPVCDGVLDKTVGLLHIKDLAFVRGEGKGTFQVGTFLKEPFFVYEHMKIQAVFDYMNRKKIHLALVKDENALVVGVVSLEDIVEEIVGEIHDEHDEEETPRIEKEVPESGLVIDAGLSLRDLASEYDIKIPLNDSYSTVAGLLLSILGNNFPEQGQMIIWKGLSFELARVEQDEIKDVKIKVVGEPSLSPQNEGPLPKTSPP